MINDAVENRWAMLPGQKWATPLQAKTWLIEQRRLLGWSHKDVANAFFECAVRSDLYSGPGGGALFDRATEKRVARFEREGQHIPDWVYWLPLVIQHAQVPLEDRWEWERENIPEHSDSRRDREEEEYHSRLFELDGNEIALITRFREMDADERDVLRFVAEPKMLRWWMDIVKRAAERDTDLVTLLNKALSQPGAGA
ncbi:hypothetical protein [Sphingobium sp. Cam5-1]|uniref:hypothetical protein n=1 Tax=Sphingobium sp. Cam5-1 TaxID=2789327 RepID=UPI0018AD28A9|nr:hypothetical protein [Sphingobium sp. Cam5-1]QPI72214.1 hypothetical protein IZV00_09935 [Sphingobium sp. Cam5-1]